MPTQCDVNFDNPTGVFYAGQEVSGTINLLTENEKTVRAIHATIVGYTKVRWTEQRTQIEHGKKRIFEEEYTAYEEYLSFRTYVEGYEGGPAFRWSPGNHSYAFRCALPPNVPTSFEGRYGHIRYEVILVIERPLNFDNIFKQAFTVIYPLDLNYDPRYRTPDHREDTKTFCCCCCTTGPMEVRLSVPFRGYVPGQNLIFTLYVDNESNMDMEDGIIGLQQEVTFKSRCPSQEYKTKQEKVTEKRIGRVLRLSRKEYKESLALPSIPPTTLDICKWIKIRYYLYARIIASDCYENACLYIPVTIGTVPLIDVQQETPINEVISWQPSDVSNYGENNDILPAYETIVPPAYVEAIKLSENFQDDPKNEQHKSGSFVARYPVFENYGPVTAPPFWEM